MVVTFETTQNSELFHLSYRNTTGAWFQNTSSRICNHCAFKLKLLLPCYFVINNFRSKCSNKQIKYNSYNTQLLSAIVQEVWVRVISKNLRWGEN